MTKNSHRRFIKRVAPRAAFESSVPLLYTVLQLILTMGLGHMLLHTVMGEVYELW